MGMSRITVVVTGNHGCRREIKNGGKVEGQCTNASCVDCATQRFVEELKLRNSVTEATHHHWPGSQQEIIDNHLTGIRTGSF